MDDCGIDCQEALKEIERFLDGELSVEAESEVRVHLSDCNPCMHRAEFRKHVKLLVHDKCGERELPAGLQDKLLRALRAHEAEG
jgi:mycothiol system anti-sigma-R factor